jgi:glycosyltransferase involved in cell wall biosynthesis
MQMPEITWSIVITTRNRSKMLQRCIESGLNQSVPVEIVVVDEASSDETEQVAKAYGSKVIYHRNEQPVGHSKAANIGIRLASGSWIKPIDDDDYLSPDCLAEMTNKLRASFEKQEFPVLITGRYARVDEFENPLGFFERPIPNSDHLLAGPELLQAMLHDRAPVGTPLQCAHSKEAAVAVGGWNENRVLRVQEGDDTEFWIRLASQGGFLFTFMIAGYKTQWPGNSHRSTSTRERYLASIGLKMQIVAALGIHIPRPVLGRVTFHWMLVALKHGQLVNAMSIAWAGTKSLF